VMGVALFLPPFGVGLYIVLGLSGATIGETSRHLLPYLATMMAVAVVIAFMLLVGSAYRIAVQARRPFSKLFAAGLATILGVQTFVIIGGVTRLIPLTGVTLPFVSYGGSSLVANFVILALLLRISDENAIDAATDAEQEARRLAFEGAET